MSTTEYEYHRHGLLFIVYERFDDGHQIRTEEDSRWEDEQKAKEHYGFMDSLKQDMLKLAVMELPGQSFDLTQNDTIKN